MRQRSKTKSRDLRVISWTTVVLLAFLGWAYVSPVAEVSSGQATVIPSSHEQIVQSLDGGILAELNVSVGDIVEAGQVIARLDPTRSQASVEEARAKYLAATARAARLTAEINGDAEITFPAELDASPDLKAGERALFISRRQGQADVLESMNRDRDLLSEEIEMMSSLVHTGAVSTVEILRQRRELAQIDTRIAQTRSEYLIKTGEELAQAEAEAEVQGSIIRGRADQLDRLEFRAPMRGIVQDIAVTTIGGVIPPNGELLTIIPVDDRLLVEARISPRDIAFIHPGQRALVKISAYDYAIFGGLEGEVQTISANTVRDEVKADVVYYRVQISTDSDALVNAAGQRFPISPGMIGTVDIQTGSRTIWQYLIKPFNRAREALRER